MREGPPLTDTAAWLEDIARQIREGKLAGHIAVVVLADEEGRIDPRLYGRSERAAHTVGLLKMAADYVSRISTRVIRDPDDEQDEPPEESA